MNINITKFTVSLDKTVVSLNQIPSTRGIFLMEFDSEQGGRVFAYISSSGNFIELFFTLRHISDSVYYF